MIFPNLKFQSFKFDLVKNLFKWSLQVNSTWLTRNFMPISRTRNILNYLYGKQSKPLATNLIRNKDIIVTRKYPISKFARFLFRYPVYARPLYQNTPLRLFQKRMLNGAGLAFVGICLRDENGCPDLLRKSFKNGLDFRNYFQTVNKPIFDSDIIRDDIKECDNVEFGEYISKGSCGAVYKAKIKNYQKETMDNVAIKMLFNYENGSNSTEIIKSSLKECISYNGTFGCHVSDKIPRKILPSHQNIVKILSVFVDEFKILGNCKALFPLALPEIYGGFGHSKTLFVVQKLYDMSLKEYLNIKPKLSAECSLAILTQCFEAIDFLSKNQVSHRDLKPENILVEYAENSSFPWIVIADFGLCSTSLKIPYETDDVCKGGNSALMAPEIKTVYPSRNTILNYSKADLWSMATIAYEIFGTNNPFYRKNHESKSAPLNGANYQEKDVPEFPSKLFLLPQLIKEILRRNPDKVFDTNLKN